MNANLKRLANEGIDTVGNILIDRFLPADGYVKNALKVGLDKSTDFIFDPKANKEVPLSEHSEIVESADVLVPLVLGFVDKGILKVTDMPLLEGKNEEMFEEGLLMQLEALMRQAIADLLLKR